MSAAFGLASPLAAISSLSRCASSRGFMCRTGSRTASPACEGRPGSISVPFMSLLPFPPLCPQSLAPSNALRSVDGRRGPSAARWRQADLVPHPPSRPQAAGISSRTERVLAHLGPVGEAAGPDGGRLREHGREGGGAHCSGLGRGVAPRGGLEPIHLYQLHDP